MKSLILTVALSLTSPAATPPQAWQPCGDDILCSTLAVPADWGRPNGPTTTLKIAKLPATGPRRGTIYFNLGGPGEQIAALPYVVDALAGLRRNFDLVTSDPRGFGQVQCPKPSPQRPVWVFESAAEYDRYRAENRDFGTACTQAAGVLAGNLDTWQVVHDIDAIRATLGLDRLNYYGNSYGTVYAQAYAEFFPDRVGRTYLDSVFDHTTRSAAEWVAPRARTDEENLHAFADWCAAEPTCALHGRDVLTTFDDVVARAPIPTPAGGRVSAARIVSRSFVGSPRGWPDLAKALAQAAAGDGTGFTVDTGARDPDLSRLPFCADYPYPTDYRDLKAVETRLRQIAPRIGWRQAWYMGDMCGGMPRTDTFPPHVFHADTRPLVANGDMDATTPPAYGQRVAALTNGRYLRAAGGHALYWSGNKCVRGYVERYFESGELPAPGTYCPGN
jgi:pimeloyl-ACP methyl ester carboxylesterase